MGWGVGFGEGSVLFLDADGPAGEVYDFLDAGGGEVGEQVVVFVEVGGAEVYRSALYDAVQDDPFEVSARAFVQSDHGGQGDVHLLGAFLELLVKMHVHGEETVSETLVVGGGGGKSSCIAG